ncbi:hypothetical protein ANSO36C_07020 [Nostoc cf. commune SO-36]|uniref:Uncharacterized protein n=1 Tax=Nostoc cf. commune SO-36 TaxID=449208 RepID=A0ABM7YW80_NOSCO|nr:hypothetical protein [Nostoc commune]BDI14900.1 hypothetical protein ANSO36C_07020 [Nostoc cf. commune SO-36]
MHEKNQKSIHEEVHSTINWLNERRNALKERLQESILEGTSENLVDADDNVARKEIIRKNLIKYIEIKNEIEFCNELKKQLLKDEDDFLNAEGKPVVFSEPLLNLDLDSIPEPRLWED